MNESPAGNVTETSKHQEKTETGSGDSRGHANSSGSGHAVDTPEEPGPAPPDRNAQARSPGLLTRMRARFPAVGEIAEAATLFGLTAFFLFYGLVPIFGGDGLGLVGADEPRYAQVAREMLTRRDYVTPVLWAHPWLEKPALYYWRAMFAFREFGVHDWSARLPSASFAFMLVVLIYLHIRRFRNGGQLDAALITASCAAVLSFARGASTDMQLAAPFCIGMLGWYAWYETNSKFWLFDIYFFVGAATLAKGPIAPVMALVIIGIFAGLRREWSLFRRSLWWPGILLYFAMVLPWFIAVQLRNPAFLRIFFLEHNIERFATDRFEHYHPFWYYIPVMLLGLTPWAVIAVTAFVDAVGGSLNEWRVRRAKILYVGHGRAGDAFPEFLVLWALVPIVFFSFSDSKLPGYILPAVPPLTILAGDYLNRIRGRGLKPWLLVLHAVLTGILTMFVLLMPLHLHNPEAVPPRVAIIAAGMVGLAATVFILITVAHFGLKRLRIATMTPMVILLLYMFGIGPVLGIGPLPNTKRNINLMDMTYSARPLAQILDQISPPPGIAAVWHVRRDVQYGLSFYRNQRTVNYDVGITVSDPPLSAGPGPHGVIVDDVREGSSAEQMGLRRLVGDNLVAVNGQPVLNARDFNAIRRGWKPGVKLEFEVLDPRIPDKAPQFASGTMQDGIPDRQHLLVIPESSATELRQTLQGRRYEPLFTYPAQNLVVYEVMASNSGTAVRSR
jgi:4-amino-4-deoxy-L-arabinose transferase-like glycosyltransferase